MYDAPVARVLDAFAVILVFGALGSFVLGMLALVKADDARALYLLALGGIALRTSVEIVRPRSAS